ncbi:MAG: hypothetical protein JO303_16995 [Caulobacteraceae bacterium]|nr:hypothetical protein [Caulobacteraceae bacterium]
MMHFGLPSIGLSLILAIALCVHVVRTDRPMYWLLIILLLQPLGGIIYLIAIVIPEMTGGTTARRMRAAARDALDPDRNYRQAKAAHGDSPTVANAMRLAAAAAGLGRHAEAEQLYREAAQGIHAEDPTLLLGRANALLELGRPSEVLPVLEQLARDPDQGRSPAAALAFARAYEGLSRMGEADEHYRSAAERLPGMEAIARYAAFQARTGRRDEARRTLDEIDARIARMKGPFRNEARAWRDLAAQALG